MVKGKTILIMGIRNKWSIAYGAAQSAYENGARVLFTFQGEENRDKIEELISEFGDAKAYECDMSEDKNIEKLFNDIKKDYGKLDGILHAIAHAYTDDLHNDFIETSKEGFSHANDISAYTLVATCRIAKELDILNPNASIVCLTYYGSTKFIPGYNVMGVAKAALEASVRYLAENLGKEGIRVNAISAGPIKTLSAKGIKDFGSMLSIAEEKAPLKRNVTIREIGDVSTFLFSSMSEAITGQVIYADNGISILGI